MTDAEKALLDAILNQEPCGPGRFGRMAESGPVADAIRCVLTERANPEQQEKFNFLYRRWMTAGREFHAFSETIQRPLMLDWYEKAEKEMSAQ